MGMAQAWAASEAGLKAEELKAQTIEIMEAAQRKQSEAEEKVEKEKQDYEHSIELLAKRKANFEKLQKAIAEAEERLLKYRANTNQQGQPKLRTGMRSQGEQLEASRG